MSRPYLRDDGVPTRADLSLMSQAELAITEAARQVEDAGASETLTEALKLLLQARDLVADYVETEKVDVEAILARMDSEILRCERLGRGPAGFTVTIHEFDAIRTHFGSVAAVYRGVPMWLSKAVT